jgi:hypothetical protein
MRYIFLFLCFISFLSSCGVRPTANNAGSVIEKQRIINYQTNEIKRSPLSLDRKRWYYDSLVICENFVGYFSQVNDGTEHDTAIVVSYSFIDLQTKSCYVYSSFSDTARLLNKFSSLKPIRTLMGWNFFDTANYVFRDRVDTLSDTSIDNRIFKRYRANIVVDQGGSKTVFERVSYLECSAKCKLFSLDMGSLKTTGCPKTKHFEKNLTLNKGMSVELDFDDSPLTDAQIKVFRKWKLNEKRNPIQ